MIVIMVLAYVAVLFLLVKIGLIKLNTFWKISPLIWGVICFIVFFLPMQWGAPQGPCKFLQRVVQMTPNVNGEVIEVPVDPWQKVKAGDVLFKIDPTQYQAAVDSLNAQLELAETRLKQSQQLLARQAGSACDVQQFQSQVLALKGQLESAQWNLDSTVVEAPADGIVLGVTLQPGNRVSAGSQTGYMTLVISYRRVLVSINQNALRNVRPGQTAEVVLKVAPGKVLQAKVAHIAPTNPAGQLAVGSIPNPPDAAAGPFAVMLEFDTAQMLTIQGGGGIAGVAAIYTESAKPTHVIRKIMLRMQAWRNYVK